jgi:hypothetical protein
VLREFSTEPLAPRTRAVTDRMLPALRSSGPRAALASSMAWSSSRFTRRGVHALDALMCACVGAGLGVLGAGLGFLGYGMTREDDATPEGLQELQEMRATIDDIVAAVGADARDKAEKERRAVRFLERHFRNESTADGAPPTLPAAAWRSARTQAAVAAAVAFGEMSDPSLGRHAITAVCQTAQPDERDACREAMRDLEAMVRSGTTSPKERNQLTELD